MAYTNKGEEGEIQVALALAKLPRGVYHDIHNLTFEGLDGTTQVDHVVVSRYGIFVVETKNYAGQIYARAEEKNWTQVTPAGKKRPFQNPLRQNYRHIKTLSKLLRIRESAFHTLIALCGEATFKSPLPEGVRQEGYEHFILSKTDVRLADADVLRVVERIKTSMLPRGEDTNQKHIESLFARHAAKPARKEAKPRPAAAPWRPKRSAKRTADPGLPRIAFSLAAAAALVWFMTAQFPLLIAGVIEPHATPAPQAPAPRPVEVVHPPKIDAPPQRNIDVAARESAWERHYQKPASCDAASADLVECGNQYIRARQAFERAYAAGAVQ